MVKIFKRKILKKPLRLEVDSGSEFKGAFKNFYNKIFDIITKIAGRHRQQAVVETKNYQIGKILNARMLAEEINNNVSSNSWVDILPKVIKLINENFAYEPKQVSVDEPVKTNKFTSDILPIGTKVRIQLDNPKGYANDEKLHGKFRAGDLRWSKTIHEITQFYLRPAQPPMYQVDNNSKVAYTKYQLQVLKDNELKPKISSQKKYLVQKILRRFKIKNKIFYEVLWGDGSKTNEPRNNLLLDIPDTIKEFDQSLK